MKIKFTTDGRKVAVLGALNATESIVQEIFIINNQEIPSGANFVAKDLHDAPAISWKDSELKRLKEQNERLISNLSSEKKQYEDQLDRQRKNFEEKTKILSDKFKFIVGAIENVDKTSFDTLLMFLEGRIKYLVKGGSYAPEVVHFSTMVEQYSDSDYWSGISLISLFGKDDGSLNYQVAGYYEGYKNFTEVIPFETEEEAIAKVKELVLGRDEYNEGSIAAAKKCGFKLDAVKLKVYIDGKKKHSIHSMENNLEAAKTYEKQIAGFDEILIDLV